MPANALRCNRSLRLPIDDSILCFYSNYYRTSRIKFDPAGIVDQEGYGLLHGRISCILPGEKLSFSIFCINLTDTTCRLAVLPIRDSILQQYGSPRTYGIQASFKY